MGIGFRRSGTCFMFNHIGHFAAAGEALAKALLLGGVTRRFPRLRVAFLEGGVHWAVGLLADVVARFEKRNIRDVQRYDPRRIDHPAFGRLVERHGAKLMAMLGDARDFSMPLAPQAVDALDDFAALRIERPEELRDLFVPSFYFGCEADDPGVALAFDTRVNPMGAKLNAMFSSDLGHWDVRDMIEILGEAFELVEHGLIDARAFRDFVFANPARFYTRLNPDFFKGTRVEAEVAKLIEPKRGAPKRSRRA
jgi:hypothetical protein